jgi:hypothetical protein
MHRRAKAAPASRERIVRDLEPTVGEPVLNETWVPVVLVVRKVALNCDAEL